VIIRCRTAIAGAGVAPIRTVHDFGFRPAARLPAAHPIR
jgi:hypothetical protein